MRALTGWQAREYWFPEIRSLYGAAAMLSFALYPYVYLLARTSFLELSRSALEAGRLAGHGAWGSFFRVAVPLARPAIAAGTALALMETLADFGAVSYFAVETFTTGIFKAWLGMGDVAAAASSPPACSASWCWCSRSSAGIAAAPAITRRRSARRSRRSGCGAVRPRPPSSPAARRCCSGFCSRPESCCTSRPLRPEAALDARVLGQIANSVSVAGVTAAAAVGVAVLMAYAARLAHRPLVVRATRASALGYAIPGAVIAVGILVPLGRLDNLLAGWIQSAFGIDVGLLFTGTIVALVYAYLVRFLAVALQTVEAGLAQVTPSMEDAARSLGAGPLATLGRVHAPLLASSLATAALLVFVDTVKELPATFALRPFNFDTLAVAAYNFTKDERLAEAAVPSLVIVAVGLLPVLFVSRRLMRPGGR